MFWCSSALSSLSTDSIFIFISRKLRGKLSILGCHLTTAHKLAVSAVMSNRHAAVVMHSALTSHFFNPQGPPGGGGPPGTPIMPSPGGEFTASCLSSVFYLYLVFTDRWLSLSLSAHRGQTLSLLHSLFLLPSGVKVWYVSAPEMNHVVLWDVIVNDNQGPVWDTSQQLFLPSMMCSYRSV